MTTTKALSSTATTDADLFSSTEATSTTIATTTITTTTTCNIYNHLDNIESCDEYDDIIITSNGRTMIDHHCQQLQQEEEEEEEDHYDYCDYRESHNEGSDYDDNDDIEQQQQYKRAIISCPVTDDNDDDNNKTCSSTTTSGDDDDNNNNNNSIRSIKSRKRNRTRSYFLSSSYSVLSYDTDDSSSNNSSSGSNHGDHETNNNFYCSSRNNSSSNRLQKELEDEQETMKQQIYQPLLTSGTSRKKEPSSSSSSSSSVLTLVVCAIGIYASFLMYGNVQETLFLYREDDDNTNNKFGFQAVWLLQVLESTASILLGLFGTYYIQRQQQQQQQKTKQRQQQEEKDFLLLNNNNDEPLTTSSKDYDNIHNNNNNDNSNNKPLPVKSLIMVGTSLVMGRGFFALALMSGVSYPVCTLAKSAKIVPVMIGQLIFVKGWKYTIRDYIFTLLIVIGVTFVSLGEQHNQQQQQQQQQPIIHNKFYYENNEYDIIIDDDIVLLDAYETSNANNNNNEIIVIKSSSSSSSAYTGIFFLFVSLLLDGITAGLQEKMKNDTKIYRKPSMYDFILYAHLTMFTIALLISIISGEIISGIQYIISNPAIQTMLMQVCITSVLGQGFIFYVIAKFNTYICTTITTTRKLLSVILSIILHQHLLSSIGWIGLLLSFIAIFIELDGHISHKKR